MVGFVVCLPRPDCWHPQIHLYIWYKRQHEVMLCLSASMSGYRLGHFPRVAFDSVGPLCMWKHVKKLVVFMAPSVWILVQYVILDYQIVSELVQIKVWSFMIVYHTSLQGTICY